MSDMAILANMTVNEQRLIKFANLSLHILRTNPSVATTEDVLHWTFASLGLVSNVILVSIILRNRKQLLKFSSNILLLNLAITNLVFVLTSISVKISTQASQLDRASSSVVLKGSSIITECQALLSNWTLAVLAIFNFYAVKSPLQFKVKVTKKMTITIIAFIWVAAVALAIPLVVITSPREMIENGEISPTYFTNTNIDLVITYTLFLDSLSNIPAGVVIITLYPLILVTLWRRRKQSERSEEFRRTMSNSMKRVWCIFISFIVYISCDVIVAFSFLHFIVSPVLDEPLSALSYATLRFLTAVYVPFQLFHTILSPLIHALLTENYRKYYLPTMCKVRFYNQTKSTEFNGGIK